MTVWFPKTDLMSHEIEATTAGRFKMWIHFTVLRNLVYPFLPWSIRKPFYESVRRWVFGPNANNEDLNALLSRLTEKIRAAK